MRLRLCQGQHVRAALLPEGHPVIQVTWKDLSRMIHGFPSCWLLLVLLFCLLSPNFLSVPAAGPCSCPWPLPVTEAQAASQVSGRGSTTQAPTTDSGVCTQTGGAGAAPPASRPRQGGPGADSLRRASAEGAAAGKVTVNSSIRPSRRLPDQLCSGPGSGPSPAGPGNPGVGD